MHLSQKLGACSQRTSIYYQSIFLKLINMCNNVIDCCKDSNVLKQMGHLLKIQPYGGNSLWGFSPSSVIICSCLVAAQCRSWSDLCCGKSLQPPSTVMVISSSDGPFQQWLFFPAVMVISSSDGHLQQWWPFPAVMVISSSDCPFQQWQSFPVVMVLSRPHKGALRASPGHNLSALPDLSALCSFPPSRLSLWSSSAPLTCPKTSMGRRHYSLF